MVPAVPYFHKPHFKEQACQATPDLRSAAVTYAFSGGLISLFRAVSTVRLHQYGGRYEVPIYSSQLVRTESFREVY